MRWRFRFVEYIDGIYRYAYSMDSDELDGEIIYNVSKDVIEVSKPSKNDHSEFLQSRTRRHFLTIVEEAFPKERAICAG
ncbi:MAG: hypothetical protein K5637_01935 [Lachnospiraceae bacterium]|nr:hypothetical protein [Lachnospiraceae bacterium]